MGLEFMQAVANGGSLTRLDVPKTFLLTAEMRLLKIGRAGVQFGLLDSGEGWALSVDAGERAVNFMQIKNGGGVLLDRGLKRCDFELNEWYPIRISYDGVVVRAYFDENPLDGDPWPKFEFALDLGGGAAALDSGRGTAEFRNVAVGEMKGAPAPAETYTNPVLVGADPDILLSDGRYYLYNRVPNDPRFSEDAYLFNGSDLASLDEKGCMDAIFRVASSEDLVHWSSYTPCFFRKGVPEGAFCMSPNVMEKDGLFYLFFAAGRMAGDEAFHVYYAVASSPLGPFEMRTVKPLHEDVQEIGGMPFIDDDGEVYMSFVRFDRGNHIWMMRLNVHDGVVTPDNETTVKAASPEEPYEADEFGRIVEGGVFIHHGAWYYMLYACCGYWGHYGEAYAVSDHVLGPYVKYPFNPILHHNFRADGVGDGIVIYNRDRSKMYMGYHRHVSLDDIEPRMTCLDEMKFVKNPKGGPDILCVRGPSTTPQRMPFREK